MQAINHDDQSIYLTRGDVLLFDIEAKSNVDQQHKFEFGDVIRLKIYKKKNAKEVVLQKDFLVTKDGETSVQCYLSGDETKLGEIISKPVDYWYEVELNPYDEPQTIIGYDDDGPKIFKLFPEGADKEEFEVERRGK